MLRRIRELGGWARQVRPDVALSHNSYGQIVAAKMLGIRAVTAMDYERQPVNHLAFRLADTVLLPTALRHEGVRGQGASPAKTRFYDGLKEEIYLGDFEPDPDVLAKAGVTRKDDEVLVVARTPPSGALYHRGGNSLFEQIIDALGQQPGVHCVVLCRRPEQRQALLDLKLRNLVLPERALDARSLLHAADLVIGAGGTMTREAALLGVPTVSVFAGPSPAVDRWLEGQGAMRRLRTLDEMPPLRRRPNEPRHPAELRARGEDLTRQFVATIHRQPNGQTIRGDSARANG
jgi:predicted glycosyltransferase